MFDSCNLLLYYLIYMNIYPTVKDYIQYKSVQRAVAAGTCQLTDKADESPDGIRIAISRPGLDGLGSIELE
jgi:hypothetical protein